MINSIIDGISKKINEVFGDKYEIYTKNIEQGLKEPCFFIFCINPTSAQSVGKRYVRKNLFAIQYFPESITEARTECNDVTEILFQALEHITVAEKLHRGIGMRTEFFDGVLTFFVNYNMFLIKQIEHEPMDTLLIENHTK